MKITIRAAALSLAVLLAAGAGWAQKSSKKAAPAAGQSYTGTVSDTMCGAKHMMAGSPADCTRACVKQGSDYALVVGDKVYTLKGDAAELDKYAGQKVKVTGKLDGTTLQASTVAPAGK